MQRTTWNKSSLHLRHSCGTLAENLRTHGSDINRRRCKIDYTDSNKPWETVTVVTEMPETLDFFINNLYGKHWGWWWCFHSVYIVLTHFFLMPHFATKQISSHPLLHSLPSSLLSLFYILEKTSFLSLASFYSMHMSVCLYVHRSSAIISSSSKFPAKDIVSFFSVAE